MYMCVCVCVCVLVIYSGFSLNVAQGRMSEAPNETQTHSWRYASLVC